ncbi:MAG: hypothetical protein IPN67_18235 [Bacteroidales bacterium]|nr:hypothetical protein [Bacteroidales bacterium]
MYSTDNKKICNLFNGKIGEGMFMITWNGKDQEKIAAYKGDYKIRWTIGNGYREFPIMIN